MSNFKQVSKELVHDYDFYKTVITTVQETTTDTTFTRTNVNHIGAVAVLPILENGNTVLIKQYRATIDDLSLEVVPGRRDVENEDLEVCGKRELQEEAGLASDELIYLGFSHTSPGYSNEVIHLYLASNCTKLGSNEPVGIEEEFATLHEMSLLQALQLVFKGDTTDSKSVAAITLAAQYLEIIPGKM